MFSRDNLEDGEGGTRVNEVVAEAAPAAAAAGDTGVGSRGLYDETGVTSAEEEDTVDDAAAEVEVDVRGVEARMKRGFLPTGSSCTEGFEGTAGVEGTETEAATVVVVVGATETAAAAAGGTCGCSSSRPRLRLAEGGSRR